MQALGLHVSFQSGIKFQGCVVQAPIHLLDFLLTPRQLTGPTFVRKWLATPGPERKHKGCWESEAIG